MSARVSSRAPLPGRVAFALAIALTVATLAVPVTAATPVASVAYHAERIEHPGSVTGVVKYAGRAPTPVRIAITKDREVCGRKPLYNQSLVVGKNGGIANAVVTIVGVHKGVALRPLADATFDQRDCQYTPHVLVVPVGSTIDIVNSDDILHNIHSYPKHGMGIDMAQPGFKRVIKVRETTPGVVRIDCDAHNWMRGWWYVADNPYYAMTDASGAFTIRDVPPGRYTLELWQESLGTQTRQIVIRPSASTRVNFTMGPVATK